MKSIVALTVVAVLGSAALAIAADTERQGGDSVKQSLVRGRVSDLNKNPVSGAQIVLLTETGEEVARAKTDTSGAYSLGCVDLGKYQHRVSAPGYQGQTVVAPLGPNGLTVSWAVDPGKPALASATASGGPCAGGAVVAGAASGAEAGPAGAVGASGSSAGETAALTLGGAALAGGVGIGIAAGVGAFDDSSRPHTSPATPAQ